MFPPAYRYPDGRWPKKPDNWEEIRRRLGEPRPSLSPSRFTEEDHERFVQADADAFKEKQVTTSVIPIIEGDVKDARCTSGGIRFRNFDPLTDGAIVPGNPDVYFGARPEQLNRRVRAELDNLIVPSTQADLPICPNFFVAAKGPDGSAAVAKRQACYDGALGARGIHSLQLYGQESSTDDNKAYTITSVYHDGTLKMYVSHRIESAHPKGCPEYHMHQLRSFAMTDSLETFKQGAAAYRNARDWTEEQRNEAIETANRTISMIPDESSSIDVSVGIEVVEESPSLSPESARYTTPPSGKQTSDTTFEAVASDTPVGETTSKLDTNKRVRQRLQSSSPAQKKRGRVEKLDDSSTPELSAMSANTPTGLSHRFEDDAPEQEGEEGDDSDNRTELLSSDEEAKLRPVRR